MSDKNFVGMSVCHWCGETKDVLIDRRLRDTFKGNGKIVIDYDFCDKCSEDNKLGTRLIEVQEKPVSNGQVPINEDLYPTGMSWVIKAEAAKDMFDNEDPIIFIAKEVAEQIGLYKLMEAQNE